MVSETAKSGLIERMTQSRLPELLHRFDPEAVRRRMTGVDLPLKGGGVTWETIEAHVVKADLRGQLNLLTAVLEENETGVLITVDEIHAGVSEDLRELATVIQHMFREEREVAFAAAGLSSAIYDLLNGREVAADALEVMVEATQGYPFMIQLVGSQCWRVNHHTKEISLADAKEGVANAERRLGDTVHASALKNLSALDKSFLLAMSKDDGPSKIADVAARLKRTRNNAAQYRLRRGRGG